MDWCGERLQIILDIILVIIGLAVIWIAIQQWKKDKSYEKVTNVVRNCFVCFGIVFAIFQYQSGQVMEHKRIAIEAIKTIHEKQFLESFRNILEQNRSHSSDSISRFADDLNYVLNTYEYISELYLTGLADKSTIENQINKSALRELLMHKQVNGFTQKYSRINEFLDNISNLKR